MQKNEFKYILRFTMQPGHHVDERLEGLVSFCRKARIDDVMFLINGEELNDGHLTIEETTPWMDLISEVKQYLEPLGTTTSINPWPTLLHGDRGRKLKPGQNFKLMTDPYGNKTSAVVCPLCDEWRKYIANIYSFYAKIKPNMLWAEDDFRFYNHRPLIWGGCFCDTHMELFSERAGKKLTRSEFLEGLLKHGEPHPYRKVWLDTCRDTMVELAAIIGDAVHKVSPETRVGLMSSSPHVHCAEGRDWKGILKGLAGNTSMVNRPTLPAYWECSPNEYIWNYSTITRMSCASVPGTTELYSELENFPYSRFSKSNAFSRYQLESSAVINPEGITLNVFDMAGNGVIMREGYHNMLADSKDFMTGIKRLGLTLDRQEGIKIPFSSQSSYTIHTEYGKQMEELYPAEGFWAGLLSSYGITNRYTLDTEHKNSILAISGQYLRNLTGKEIEELFANNFILLEGEAAYTLLEMGYGRLAGMKNAIWHQEDSGFQAYEQVCNRNVYSGLSEARTSAQACASDLLEIEYCTNPDLITVIKDPRGENAAPGMVICGNVLIMPYKGRNEMHRAHLNPIKQEIVQNVLKNCRFNEQVIFTEGVPYVSTFMYNLGEKKAIVALNSSIDDTGELKIYAPFIHTQEIMELNRQNTVPVKSNAVQEGEYIVLKDGLAAMDMKVLIL